MPYPRLSVIFWITELGTEETTWAVIALSAREALFEYQDNSVSVLLAHGSRVFLAGDAEKKAEEYMANGSYTGPLAIIGVLKL